RVLSREHHVLEGAITRKSGNVTNQRLSLQLTIVEQCLPNLRLVKELSRNSFPWKILVSVKGCNDIACLTGVLHGSESGNDVWNVQRLCTLVKNEVAHALIKAPWVRLTH